MSGRKAEKWNLPCWSDLSKRIRRAKHWWRVVGSPGSRTGDAAPIRFCGNTPIAFSSSVIGPSGLYKAPALRKVA